MSGKLSAPAHPRSSRAGESNRSSRRRWKVIGICLLLALLVFTAFGETLHHGFINLDDTDYVLGNPQVTHGLSISGVVWAFTHSHSSNWHPLTWISHMLDCELYGVKPFGHHLTNLLLHLATTIALFLFLLFATNAFSRSAFVAAVFALHPLRVESVAWVAERKDCLSGLFFVLTLAAYFSYARRPRLLAYLLVALCFTLGLLAKPMLVTIPLILLLLDYWPLERLRSRHDIKALVLEKVPFFVMSAASSVATILAQKNAIQPIKYISLSMRIANAIESTVVYLRQLFWPADLAVFYPWTNNTISVFALVFSLIIVIGITLGIVLLANRRYLITGWFWYLIMLLPVIGLLQVGGQTHADRYSYLPQIGLCILITWGVVDVARFVPALLLRVAAVIVVVALMVLTRGQAAYWRDSETLWKHAVAVTGENPVAEVFLGQSLAEAGKPAEAIAHYEHVLRSDPGYAPAYSALGVVSLENGSIAQSRRYLEQALALIPDYAEAHYNLGNTLMAAGDLSGAIAHYTRAIELNPDDFQAENNLAWILATSSARDIRNGSRAVELASRANRATAGTNPTVNATLAAAYAEAGRFDEAIKTAEYAIQLAKREGNEARAAAIALQLQSYRSGAPFRETDSH